MDRKRLAERELDPLLDQAAAWFFELRSSNVRIERIEEWQAWLSSNPANRSAFESIEALWSMSGELRTPPWPGDPEVVSDRYRGTESVSEWQTRESRRRRISRPASRAALAACLVVVAGIGAWLALKPPSFAVHTAIGETRNVTLPDGSAVEVSGRTTLEATFATHSREVALQQGEAFFHVAKDPARPFVVLVGKTSVTAVGTSFNVRRAVNGVAIVAVAEGTVRIDTANAPAISLTAGRQAKVAGTGEPADVLPVDMNRVAGWRDGRLQYMDEPLDAVVTDLARYSLRRIEIGDTRIRQLRVTGVVFRQNIDGWLSGLEATLPIHAVRKEDGSVSLEYAANGNSAPDLR